MVLQEWGKLFLHLFLCFFSLSVSCLFTVVFTAVSLCFHCLFTFCLPVFTRCSIIVFPTVVQYVFTVFQCCCTFFHCCAFTLLFFTSLHKCFQCCFTVSLVYSHFFCFFILSVHYGLMLDVFFLTASGTMVLQAFGKNMFHLALLFFCFFSRFWHKNIKKLHVSQITLIDDYVS